MTEKEWYKSFELLAQKERMIKNTIAFYQSMAIQKMLKGNLQ